MEKQNRYSQIIEEIFFAHYREGADRVEFKREDLTRVAANLGIQLPKNLGDLIYSFRYRASLPERIKAKAPKGKEWVISPAGRAEYAFVAKTTTSIAPSLLLAETKIPDATPGIIAKYALNDEQALLAKVRYNRLIDIFTGVACYSLQSHLRTTVPKMGQVETDEIYIGIDKRGVHYVFPIQAKGGKDKLGIIQIEQDMALCLAKFPSLVCRAIAAQFMGDGAIALFEFERTESGIAISSEKHYRLVPPDQMTAAELETYQKRAD